MKRHLLLALALASLSACGGGGGGSVAPAAKSAPTTVTGNVTISIPTSTTTSSKVRFPQFVSPNASSVSLVINGGTAQTFDVSATSSLCVTTSGTRNCDLAFGAPVGSDTFVFTVYSGANATGQVLATAPAKDVVVAGSPFSFTVALNAVLGSVVFSTLQGNSTGNCENSPAHTNGVTEGCAGSGTAALSFFDPSGATITGTTPFAAPAVITSSDPSLTTTPAQITAPISSLTLTYSGAAFAPATTSAITLTLTAGGSTSQFTVPATRQYLYVANSNAPSGTAASGGGNIAVYTFGASGSTTPARTIAGANTLLENPVSVALDGSNDLYVLDNGIYTTQAHPVILEFAPDVSGNLAPIGEISGLAGVTTNLPCETLIFDPTKTHLLVSCDDSQIHVFPVALPPPGSGGAVTLQVGAISSTAFVSPVGMAYDAQGNLYVSDTSLGEISYFPNPVTVTGAPNLTPTFTMGSGGGTAWPYGVNPLSLAIDDQGTLFATIAYVSPTAGAQDAGNQLAIWKTTSIPCNNNCAPGAALEGTAFAHAPTGVAFDALGNIYISNEFQNTVTEYAYATVYGASGTTANAQVLRTLSTGSSPDGPTGVAVGP